MLPYSFKFCFAGKSKKYFQKASKSEVFFEKNTK